MKRLAILAIPVLAALGAETPAGAAPVLRELCKPLVASTAQSADALAARSMARANWTRRVSETYGPSWASSSRRKNVSAECEALATGHICVYRAAPCKMPELRGVPQSPDAGPLPRNPLGGLRNRF